MTDQQILDIIVKQEEVLQFDHFTNEDALAVGNAIINEAKEGGFAPAIEIKYNNGYTVFKYGFDGTGPNNDHWLTRKEKVAQLHMCSTMKVDYLLKTSGAAMTDWYMDPMEYSTCPGAFPIHVKGAGMIGLIMVSGISVLTDHDLIIGALMKYLGVTDLERVQD